MKKVLSVLLALSVFLGLALPASAAQGTGSFHLTALNATYQGNSLVLESVIANTGNATLRSVSHLELDVYDKNNNYVDGTILNNDPWLSNLVLAPGESTDWTLTIQNFKKADLSTFTVKYSADFVNGPAEFTSGIKIVVNNSYLQESSKAIIQNGTTLVPMRAIFESLGAEVTWNQKTKTVTATRGNDKLVLKIGDRHLTFNGQKVALSVPAKVVNSSTLVPLRVISESFNGVVSYGKKGKATTISILTN